MFNGRKALIAIPNGANISKILGEARNCVNSSNLLPLTEDPCYIQSKKIGCVDYPDLHPDTPLLDGNDHDRFLVFRRIGGFLAGHSEWYPGVNLVSE
jgi:hypothetical protein